jgi:hypothetical protein
LLLVRLVFVISVVRFSFQVVFFTDMRHDTTQAATLLTFDPRPVLLWRVTSPYAA